MISCVLVTSSETGSTEPGSKQSDNTQAHAAGVRAAMKFLIGLRLAEKNMRIEDPESCFRSSAHSFSDGSPSAQGLLSTKQACHQPRLVREQREGGQCRTDHTIGR